MTRIQLRLDPTTQSDDSPRLVPPGDVFLFVGRESDGVNYLCPGCASVLAFNILPGQVRDIIATCGYCGKESSFPKVAQGEPIPPKTSFVVLSRLNRLPETIPFPHRFAMMVSRQSAERYSRETGTIVRWMTNPNERPEVEVDPLTGLGKGSTPHVVKEFVFSVNSIVQLERRFHSVMGPGLAQLLGECPSEPTIPAQQHHPACEEVRAFRDAASSLERGSSLVDHIRLAQGILDVMLLERWCNHPFFRAAGNPSRIGVTTVQVTT
jgi:hypothetical protein